MGSFSKVLKSLAWRHLPAPSGPNSSGFDVGGVGLPDILRSPKNSLASPHPPQWTFQVGVELEVFGLGHLTRGQAIALQGPLPTITSLGKIMFTKQVGNKNFSL